MFIRSEFPPSVVTKMNIDEVEDTRTYFTSHWAIKQALSSYQDIVKHWNWSGGRDSSSWRYRVVTLDIHIRRRVYNWVVKERGPNLSMSKQTMYVDSL